jgi:hypothetical protein
MIIKSMDLYGSALYVKMIYNIFVLDLCCYQIICIRYVIVNLPSICYGVS